MRSLRSVLLINAVSSGATGVVLWFASKVMAELFGTSQTLPFVGVGVFLIAFAVLVFLVSQGNPINTNAARLIIAGDLLWVGASLLIILLQVFNISRVGYLLIGAVALWVAVMAFLQISGLNKIIKSN